MLYGVCVCVCMGKCNYPTIDDNDNNLFFQSLQNKEKEKEKFVIVIDKLIIIAYVKILLNHWIHLSDVFGWIYFYVKKTTI